MTDKRRYTFDRQGHVKPPKSAAAIAATPPKPRRSGSTRKYLTQAAERILADCYPGQVPAAVIERALKRMATADERAARKAGNGRGGKP